MFLIRGLSLTQYMVILVSVFSFPPQLHLSPNIHSNQAFAFALPLSEPIQPMTSQEITEDAPKVDLTSESLFSDDSLFDESLDYQGDSPSDEPDAGAELLRLLLNDGFNTGNLNKGAISGDRDSRTNPTLQSRTLRTRHRGHRHNGKITCSPTPQLTLQRWMGPAFNPRYMKVHRPHRSRLLDSPSRRFGSSDDSIIGLLSDQPFDDEIDEVEGYEEFSVDKGFRRHLPEDSKYITYDEDETNNTAKENIETVATREKRGLGLGGFSKKTSGSASTDDEPWKCQSREIWHDLGDNFYPRYIRHIECLETRCYFQNFGCKERSFTLKVLKRISDECVPVYANGSNQEPTRYEKKWIFQEMAVPFCCECRKLS